MRWLHALLAVAMNAVPVVGVLAFGWSVPTILVLFWLENVAITVAHCLRIAAHRRLTRRAGHWQHVMTSNRVEHPTTLLAGYAWMAGFFTFGHGIFVLLFALLVIPQHGGASAYFDAGEFLAGARILLLITALDLALDLVGLRERSYAWIDQATARRMGRVVILHLGILFGAMAIAMSKVPVAMLMVLLGLKAVVDLAAALAGDKPGAADLTVAKGHGDPERILDKPPRR